MQELLAKFHQSSQSTFKLSILIPSWNNLTYLQHCIESIVKNSYYENQIIIIANEGTDGTVEWLKTQTHIDFIHASKNIGICYALNIARSMVKSNYIVYVNDDMYLLPNWDKEIVDEIDTLGTNKFMLSATMIEPNETGNQCVVVRDYGTSIENFEREKLLSDYKTIYKEDWNGSTWPPNVVHVDMWDLVGGLSPEFSPGMYSDPDFSKKLYDAGVRIFKGKGTSLVYHFGSKSTRRIKTNLGRKTFLLKWGITSKTFTKEVLNIGKSFSPLPDSQPLKTSTKMLNRIKRILSC